MCAMYKQQVALSIFIIPNKILFVIKRVVKDNLFIFILAINCFLCVIVARHRNLVIYILDPNRKKTSKHISRKFLLNQEMNLGIFKSKEIHFKFLNVK